jgi:hypothetical protein
LNDLLKELKCGDLLKIFQWIETFEYQPNGTIKISKDSDYICFLKPKLVDKYIDLSQIKQKNIKLADHLFMEEIIENYTHLEELVLFFPSFKSGESCSSLNPIFENAPKSLKIIRVFLDLPSEDSLNWVLKVFLTVIQKNNIHLKLLDLSGVPQIANSFFSTLQTIINDENPLYISKINLSKTKMGPENQNKIQQMLLEQKETQTHYKNITLFTPEKSHLSDCNFYYKKP